MEFMMTIEGFVTIGEDVGGENAFDATRSVMSHLRTLLKKSFPGKMCSDIHELALLIRIDGDTHKFKFRGPERIRLNRKKRYISIDIGLEKGDWDVPQSKFKKTLSEFILDGLERVLERLRKNRITCDENRIRAIFIKVLASFNSRKSTDKDNTFEEIPSE
jgi:hypothetical protein